MRNPLLWLLYYLVFSPLSLLIRLFHDPLHRGWDPTAAHYWHYRHPAGGPR
ncbi:hypothetical protein [Streptomyces sp. NPDC056796]|uniref:hypothetical protein n=1 Tax=Streptomyces sp. NPDC056796 TaxID=3345947 RepID=UPI0036C8A96E